MKKYYQSLILASILAYANFSLAQCPTVTETITDESCTGACDGQIQVDITSGTAPYSVEWFDGGGTSLGVITNVASTETITGLCAGNYSVEVTSAGGGGASTIWTEDFESGVNGWTLNVPTGVNGADNNYWEIDDDEAGMPAGVCGTAGNGDESMHITSVFNPGGGAAYDAGGLCGILFCPEANVRAESPNISTVGATGLTLNFVFIGNGDGLIDNASLWYNDGGGWVQLDPSLKSNLCAIQGEWTAYSIALPASCENIPNLQIGFNWTNNDDGFGSDPSFAVDDIEIVSTSGGPGCTTTEAYVVGSSGPCACPITITETITDESCPTLCDGEISINIANGTGPYDVEWFDDLGNSIATATGVAATDVITGLCAGDYSVEVTEAGGGGGGGPATVWTEDFESGINGWTLNVPTGVNGADNNYWEIDDDEGGMPAGQCGVAGNGDETMHITSVFNPAGGAAYDAGGLCGILFCPEANVRAESPNISTVGFTGLTLNFVFIGNGDGLLDNASLWYNDGGGWVQLDPSLKSNLCALQGEWTAYSVALPASCENIPNLQIGFNWTNNDDAAGSDPSFAVNDIEIVATTSGGGGSGCTQTANFTINPGVNPTITNEASTDITNCTAPDGTITITANGDNYELFTSGGASVSTNTTGSFTGLAAGDYYVEVSLNGCITTSSTFTISNASAPAAPTAGVDATYCVGDPMVDLTANAGSGGTLNWYSDAGLTTNIGTGPTLNPGTTQGVTTYYVTETVAGCESAASTVTITINVCCDLDVTTVITDESCDGLDDGEVEITLTGSGTYNGLVDGVLVAPGLTGPTTQTIPGLADGTYSIQIVDINDPTCDTTFNITINPGATVPITSESATDITDCLNPDGTFTVTATGATTYELYTSAGGLVTTNATGSFTGLNAGDYYVVASDGTCTGQSSTLTINNASAPAAPSAGLDATYCNGDPIADLTATAGAGGTLNWYDDAALTNNIGTGVTLTPGSTVGTTIYYVTETVAGCESAASSVTITIDPIPAAPTAGTDATYCFGDALANMTATAGSGGNLNWYDDIALTNNIGSGTTQTPNNTVGVTTYYVTEAVGACISSASTVTITINDVPAITSEIATDLTDCVTANGTITITSNGTSFELFDSANNSIATNTSGAFTGLGSGDYYVVISNGNCTATSSTLTIIDATSTSTNTINAQACAGTSYTFADGTTQTINSNTSYVSILTNAVGCDSIITENVTVVQPTTTVIDTTICEGTDYTSVGDAANFVNVLADFQHTSTLTGANGCDSIIIENITVTPTANVDLGIDFTACEGEELVLTATSTAGVPVWSTGDTAMSITVTASADTFFVAAVNGICGSDSDTVNITILPAPIIDAGPDVTVPLGATVPLSVTSTTSPIYYQWSPSTGLSCTDCDDPEAGPISDMTYIVSGTDENGCIGYDTISVVIDGEVSLYIPNVFSPNKDGQNDEFRVYGPQFSTYKLDIYNRWGSLIWSTEEPGVGWGGLHKNGQECPQAVFTYKFYGVSVVGIVFERAGTVMLTR